MSNPVNMEQVQTRLANVAQKFGDKELPLFRAITGVIEAACLIDPEVSNVRDAYWSVLDNYWSGDAWTVDEAFGGEAFGLDAARKGANKETARFFYEHGWVVYMKVSGLLEDGAKTAATRDTESVFEIVARDYPRGPDSIKETYYRIKKIMGDNHMP